MTASGTLDQWVEIPEFKQEMKSDHTGVNDPLKHWVDMPEFIQEKKEPFKTLIVRFDTEEDYLDFQDKIDQKLTNKTKCIWHPYKNHQSDILKLWVEESE